MKQVNRDGVFWRDTAKQGEIHMTGHIDSFIDI